MTFHRYNQYKVDQQLLKQFLRHHDRLYLLYGWVQAKIVNTQEFKDFIEIDIAESRYQRDLDSF